MSLDDRTKAIVAGNLTTAFHVDSQAAEPIKDLQLIPIFPKSGVAAIQTPPKMSSILIWGSCAD
jgi:hypothetical protein